jgi:filamentous hemagglutinin
MAARGIKLPTWDVSNPASIAAWRQASSEFAAGASGNVRVLQGDAVGVKSVWAEVEFPALKANPNVTTITAVNPKTGEAVLLWSR